MNTKFKSNDGTESALELSREDGRLFIAVHGLQVEFSADAEGLALMVTQGNETLGELRLERTASGDFGVFHG